MQRRGITCAGNFIIDRIKIVDLWPKQGMLAMILEERRSTGGCAYNVLKDLAKLQTDMPLFGIGAVSDDGDGNFILDDLSAHGIDTEQMRFIEGEPTSYTDVITVKDTGDRTFFYNRGANGALDVEHFDFSKVSSKIFHAGYILLLDSLDAPDEEYGTRMARLLSLAKKRGLLTSVDLVSESSDRFKKLVFPALKYTDYLIVNEIEAGRTAGYEIRTEEGALDVRALERSLETLSESGNSKLVCIHFPEGAYACEAGGAPRFVPSHKPPDGFIKGTVGAGDAFCAGMLYGIHEEWDLGRAMRFANAMACFCLTDTTTTGGMRSIGETRRLMEEMPLREGIL
ncbi:MAG: carbohydrate kinase family protein [Spirochaetes bacterium]|nr:carbohydrate kinase family protein [Spirochaetota bacterium]